MARFFKILIIMKRVIFLTSLLTLIGCTCLPQIPIQTIYADENCQAELPNYLPAVSVLDNCENATLTQEPLPGTILDAGNPYIKIIIKAKDISGNEDTESFDVVLMDTIPPEIIIDTSLLSYTKQQQSLLFTAWYNSVRNDMYSANLPDSIYSPGLDSWYKLPNLKEVFDSMEMVTVMHPGGWGLTKWREKND